MRQIIFIISVFILMIIFSHARTYTGISDSYFITALFAAVAALISYWIIKYINKTNL